MRTHARFADSCRVRLLDELQRVNDALAALHAQRQAVLADLESLDELDTAPDVAHTADQESSA